MGEKKKHAALWATGMIAAIILGSAAVGAVPNRPVQAATTTEQTNTTWSTAAEQLEETALLQDSAVPVTWQTPVIEQNGNTLTVDTQTTLLDLVKRAQNTTDLDQAWAQIGQQVGWRLAMVMTRVSTDQLPEASAAVLQFPTSAVTGLFNQASVANPNYAAVLTQVAAKCNGVILAPALQALQTIATQQGWANLGVITDGFVVTSQPLSDLLITVDSPAKLNTCVQQLLQQLTWRIALQVSDGLQPQILPDGAAAQLAAFLKEPIQNNNQTIGAALQTTAQQAQFVIGQATPNYGQIFAEWQTFLIKHKPEQGADNDQGKNNGHNDSNNPDLTTTGDNDPDQSTQTVPGTTSTENQNSDNKKPVKGKNDAVLTVDNQPLAGKPIRKGDSQVIVISEKITSVQYETYGNSSDAQGMLPQTGEDRNADQPLQFIGLLLLGLVALVSRGKPKKII